jgi:formylglycine-generating enzyme required for sulfatase activity
LQHAHEKGLVHRDVKPGNLLRTDAGQIKVLDLGLALVLEATALTKHTGAMMGTIDYMAPEQVIDAHKVDIRADVYSLGCTLYHLLAGQVPFDNVHPAARLLIRQQQDPQPIEQHCTDVPSGLAAVVRRLLARQPENRYSTPGEAADALQPFSVARATSQAPVPPLPPPPPPPSRGSASSDEGAKEEVWPVTDSGTSRPRTRRSDRTRSLEQGQTRPGDRRGDGAHSPRAGKWLVVALVLLLLSVGGGSAVLLLATGNREPDQGQSQTKGKANRLAFKGDSPGEDRGQPTDLPQTITNSIGMKLVLIPAGKFTMGSPKAEKDREDEEQHLVTITKPFYMGVYEVTQKQYRTVMGKNPSYFCSDGDGKDKVKGLDTDDFPVESVSWEDTQTFLEKLNALAGEKKFKVKYRLPTEAEWEYACRGGPRSSSKPFHFKSPSDSLGAGQANFDARYPYGDGKKGEESKRTNTVGQNGEPNALGLFDMHGNVWEWCSDWYGEDYYGKSPPADPTGPSDGSSRVYRGGGWDNFGQSCRAANRRGSTPSIRVNYLGFRVAAVPQE